MRHVVAGAALTPGGCLLGILVLVLAVHLAGGLP
jgi:hypothetical protein